MLKRIIKIASWVVVITVVLITILVFYVRIVSVIEPPVTEINFQGVEVSQPDSGLFTIKNNWFRKSESGLYELYVEGDALERGVANGLLTKDLVQYQEEVFTNQINQFVPAGFYQNLLKYGIGFFNRNMDEHVPKEYQLEILGVSQSASRRFDYIAQPYQRILNYHGAHDIGHALQNMSLVGCTAFATWGHMSADSSLLIGRNFDFYVGDDFARDKIVAFYNPTKGYKFMMVTFGGMTGVLSGMNVAGLTVTINAAKSEVPTSAATPVSLVAREILQYASTIDEAYQIASKRKMFVAESFLIGSAKDGRAAIIEKSPNDQDLVSSSDNYIICTNHFQSQRLGETALNKEHMRVSASPYRYDRVRELVLRQPNSVDNTVSILRNQLGVKDEFIGLGNEKLINQLVAHHGIVFQPEKKRVWISTAPWQLGKFVCYDLEKVFARKMGVNEEVYEHDLTIAQDRFMKTVDYQKYQKYHRFRFPFAPKVNFNPDSVVTWNPESYHSYMMAGDFCFDNKEYARAQRFYREGLSKNIATHQERDHMERSFKKCEEMIND